MVSLPQMKKIHELYEQDYITVENPEHKDLGPMEMPIGGPIMVKSPEGVLYEVYADGSMVLYEE